MNIRSEISKYLFVHTKAYSMDLDIAIENRILFSEKLQNPNFLRFTNEYQRESVHYLEANIRRDRYYSLQQELINPEITDIDLRLYSICGIAVVRAITEAIEKRYIDNNLEYLKDYVVRTIFHL
ncbi:MAG: hypothetical protein Q4B22_08315 [Eubacteriales bacterium]|nr:hypothetical protein [Eubacteriales bacterium]